MKWSLIELRKSEFPIYFESKLNLNENIKKVNDDVLNCDDILIKGTLNKLKDNEYLVNLNIQTKLILRCQVSLEPIDYNLNLNIEEAYGNKEDDYQFENEILDLTNLIEDSIIFNIPMKIVKKGYEDKYSSNKEEVKKESPFAVLKDYFKEK